MDQCEVLGFQKNPNELLIHQQAHCHAQCIYILRFLALTIKKEF